MKGIAHYLPVDNKVDGVGETLKFISPFSVNSMDGHAVFAWTGNCITERLTKLGRNERENEIRNTNTTSSQLLYLLCDTN